MLKPSAKRIRLMNGLLGIALLSCMCLLGSCASKIGPYCPPSTLARGAAKGVVTPHAVAIVNAQDSTEEHTLEFRGIVVNYQEVTQSLVDALKAELSANGVTVADAAEKTLSISVTQITMPQPDTVFSAYLHVEVKTGDGQLKKLMTRRSSYASPFNMSTVPKKPLNAAFRDMVKKILTTKAIQEYLGIARDPED